MRNQGLISPLMTLMQEFVEDLSFGKDACEEYLKQIVQCSLESYPKGEWLGVARKHVQTLTGANDDDMDA